MNNKVENQEVELIQVYKKAKKRVHFKIHFGFYFLILTFLWLVWFFIFKKNSAETLFLESILFLTLAWTLVLIGHYLYSYKWNNTLVENEIKNLLKNHKEINLTDDQISEIVKSNEKNLK